MFALLFATSGVILSAKYSNITIDQSALLALKSHITHDPHNLLATNWSTSTSICNWIGVTCGSRHHRVIALNLSSMDLTGTIPSQLGNLSFLCWLDIHDNNFHGSISIELADLHRLKYLDFGNNSFDGEIPSWFGCFTKLQRLTLYHNNFIGVIPSTLGNLSKLERLSLGRNQISGRIPNSLFKCKELKFLSLFSNSLEGSIPAEIGNLTLLNTLILESNYLKGLIPSSIFNISSLQVIALSDNNLSGHLFPNMFDYLPQLYYLDLEGCQLYGRIQTPPPSLQWYGVSDNNFIGGIPSLICNLTSLTGIDLSKNNLDGTIPECLGNLSSSLLEIFLENNNFHGQIPENFAKGCMLKSFRVNNNKLEGSLPRSLANCKDLNLLDVGNNNLNDTFPNWLGNLDRLHVLILRSNRFYGQVGSFDVTVSLTRLRIIDLSCNNFSGYLPTNFFEHLHAIREGYEKKVEPEYMQQGFDKVLVNYASGLSITSKGLETEFEILLSIWTVIDLSNNQFSGEIPKILGELHLLIVLNLSHNCLIGPIPSYLGDLSELESLDLSSNKLEGRIPTELKNLGFLEVLNLSQNKLKGPIPQGKQFDTFTNDSYMENLDLCGLPLSKSCDTDEETPAKFDRDDDDSDELNWKFSILMGYGCGLVLGMSMGYIVFTTGKPWWLIQIVERVRQRFAKR
ncbi:hypothetical protein PVK06_041533 [Gossypium arboreum]|uniref:Leucine-rich repeat-containing N-terminal plant-type domain-containing protein n=1 Tax=Gossypium arboreum TaxID=29729 RepID=A0ABR0NAM6_GOSAR|nr:hypothetical protein PVK06_041533 [Gossypium arboreum]